MLSFHIAKENGGLPGIWRDNDKPLKGFSG